MQVLDYALSILDHYIYYQANKQLAVLIAMYTKHTPQQVN